MGGPARPGPPRQPALGRASRSSHDARESRCLSRGADGTRYEHVQATNLLLAETNSGLRRSSPPDLRPARRMTSSLRERIA